MYPINISEVLGISRKVAPSYLSSPLAVQATFPFVWGRWDVPDLERLCIGFSLGGGPFRFSPGPRRVSLQEMA